MSTEHTLQCMEVWGGNTAVDAGVVMAGLDARVLSAPLGGAGGGDVYYLSSCASGRITRLLVADVSGHGLPAAESGASLRRSMRRFVNHVDQARFLRALNRNFIRSGDPGFATAAAVSYVGPRGELTLSLAGHPAPLHRSARDGAWSLLRPPRAAEDASGLPSGLPLGVDQGVQYEQHRVKLAVGDVVVLYSDALIEARSAPEGRRLGEAGLLEIAGEIRADDPATIIAELRGRLGALAPGNLADDDVTILAFRPNGLGARVPLARNLLAPFRLVSAMVRGLMPDRSARPGEPHVEERLG